MIVYHCTSFRKINKYLQSGQINPPVRAWENLAQAERYSISTHNKIILRLKFPDQADKLKGHFKEARVLNYPYKISKESV